MMKKIHQFLFLLEDGIKAAELDGKYRFVTYAGENYKLYVITDENEFRRIHALSQKTEMDYDISFPITTASYCARKDLWLAVGEHGYCIFDGSTGNLLAYDSLWMDMQACAWEGFDEASYTHDGNGYILIGKEGTVFMRATSENSFEAGMLLEEGGVSRICRQVYYSSDGNYVYLESENGDLTKWVRKKKTPVPSDLESQLKLAEEFLGSRELTQEEREYYKIES